MVGVGARTGARAGAGAGAVATAVGSTDVGGARVVAVVPAAQANRALDVLRAAPGGAQAALIGVVSAGSGRVTLRSPYGTDRPLDLPAGELLPRIC